MSGSNFKLLCLVNLQSGGGRGRKIAELFSAFRKIPGGEVEVRILDRTVELPEPAELDGKFTDVLIAGGDGTFSTVLQRYVGCRAVFHFLPLGTGNDLPRELGVSGLWQGSPGNFIQESLLLPVDSLSVWQVQIKPEVGPDRTLGFVNYVSLGWDAAIVCRFDRLRRSGHPLSGKFGPWGNRLLYGFSGLFHPGVTLPQIVLQFQGEQTTLPARFRSIIISNIRSVMGLGKIHRDGSYSDEVLEILPIPRIAHYAQMLIPHALRTPRMRTGLLSADKFSLSFESGAPPVFLQVDGEVSEPVQGGSMSFSMLGKVKVRVLRNDSRNSEVLGKL